MVPGKLSGTSPGDDPLWQQPRKMDGQPLTILVVEDHSAYRLLLDRLLHKLGVDCEAVGDGQVALAAMERRHFDLVLSDCQMPVIDGYAMAREIRRRERTAQAGRVPVIALTTSAGPDEIRRGVEAGMDAWLLKPPTLERLCEVLERWLPCFPRSAASWPTRANLVETFGCASTVEYMLRILVCEVQEDLAALAQAQLNLDVQATTRHLHRLVGSVAFLGDERLETRGRQLITAVARDGVAAHAQPLILLHQEVSVYRVHLSAI